MGGFSGDIRLKKEDKVAIEIQWQVSILNYQSFQFYSTMLNRLLETLSMEFALSLPGSLVRVVPNVTFFTIRRPVTSKIL